MATPATDPAVTQLLNARQHNGLVAAPQIQDLDHAYRIQKEVAQAMGWSYPQAAFWKSGGSGPDALQTHAPLPDAGVRSSPATLSDFPFHLREVEVEIAVRLGTAVDAATAAGLTAETAAGLIDAYCVSIEIVDTRWAEGLAAPALAKLADLQAHGALVLGAWLPWHDRNWAEQVCEVRIGHDDMQSFRGTHPLGSPQAVLPKWLNHICAQAGSVAAGTVVTTGSWCGMLHAQAGDKVQARFEGIGEAELQF